MASAILSGIPESLMKVVNEKIIPLLKWELEKLRSLPELIEVAKNELETIDHFLKKAEKKEEKSNARVKKQMRELRKIKFKIEDIIEEYANLVKREEEGYSNGSFLHAIFSSPASEYIGERNMLIMNWKTKLDLASSIVRIQKMLEKMKGTKNSYYQSIFKTHEDELGYESESESETDPQSVHQKKLHDPGVKPLYKDEIELVGMKDHKEELKKLLDLEMEKHKRRSVVAVWGEPGVGKTTLVRKVYGDEDLRKHFSLHAWITATTPYNTVDLLKCLFKQFLNATNGGGGSSDSNSVIGVAEMQDNEVLITDQMRNFLKQEPNRRYLVVLDDVSEMGRLARWIKAALVPSLDDGSRILMTTNSEGIANYWKKSAFLGDSYNLPYLSDKEAGELFDKKAFGQQRECPWKLKTLRDEIVKECDGLPYLIEKIGARFSTTEKWIELYQSFRSNPLHPRSKGALLASYHQMPFHLKACFLYMCMFPKGYEVDRMRLVRLWIAEGFVNCSEDNTPEEVAEEYLNELVERGMVRVTERDQTGRNRKFKLLRIWNQIMRPKLEDLCFCQVLPKHGVSDIEKSQCRRVSMHGNVQHTVIPRNVRSILSFVEPETFPISWKIPFLRTAFRLRVLDLQNAKFDNIPHVVGRLHSLQYLSLRNTQVKVLPESIAGLWNLKTLDLKQSLVEELPREINALSNLRHLLVGRYIYTKTVHVKIPPEALKSFTQLQKLAYIDGSSFGLVENLQNLTQLRRLAIAEVTEEDGVALCNVVEQMRQLCSLSIMSKDNNVVLDLNHIKCPPPFLERLVLEGPLKEWPTWVSSLNHLVKLRLRYSGFTKDPLGLIRTMKELLVLELEAYDGEQLNFGRTVGFENLQVLHLKNLPNLKEIKAGIHVLTNLREVAYQDCPMKDIHKLPTQISKILPSQEGKPST